VLVGRRGGMPIDDGVASRSYNVDLDRHVLMTCCHAVLLWMLLDCDLLEYEYDGMSWVSCELGADARPLVICRLRFSLRYTIRSDSL